MLDARRSLLSASIPFLLVALVGLAAPAAPVLADDEPAMDEPAKDAPKKAKQDDESIFKDWKMVKTQGTSHAKARATFWEEKGTTGKDLCWLGAMWNRAEDYPKAIATWEKYLDWVPPAGNDKAKTTNDKNREYASRELIRAYLEARDKWAQAISAATKFREEFGGSAAVPETWDDQGQAHRMLGETDKALEAFGEAASKKQLKGLLDVVDIHLAAGDLAKAKAAFDTYPMDGASAGTAKVVKEFVDRVGTAAPSLEKAVSVGPGEAPTAWGGKPIVLFFWNVQTAGGIMRLQRLPRIARAAGDVQVLGICTYNKYNTTTQKLEEGMTEEEEVKIIKTLVDQQFGSAPPSLLVPREMLAGLGLQRDAQVVVVDKHGKLRYMRINEYYPYDRDALELALKKIATE